MSLVAMWLARRVQRRDQGSVNCELDAAPRRQAIGNDLYRPDVDT